MQAERLRNTVLMESQSTKTSNKKFDKDHIEGFGLAIE
jgi:hypothetical protein